MSPVTVPTVKLSPVAWSKLQIACMLSSKECGFYGITPRDNCLLINDLYLPKQNVTAGSVVFDDDDVAAYYAEYCKAGFIPRQLSRVWIHRHPNLGLTPSHKDEETFNNIIGEQDVGIMMIYDKQATATWIQFNKLEGVNTTLRIKADTVVDYFSSFTGFDAESFVVEFNSKVNETTFQHGNIQTNYYGGLGFQYRKNEGVHLAGKEDAEKPEVLFSENMAAKRYINCDECLKLLTSEEIINNSLCIDCQKPISRCNICYDTKELKRCKVCERLYNDEFGENKSLKKFIRTDPLKKEDVQSADYDLYPYTGYAGAEGGV